MYVDYSIKINFADKLPPDYVNLLKEAEEHDNNENYVAYDNCVEAIGIGAKLMCQNGRISTYEWDILMRRYRS